MFLTVSGLSPVKDLPYILTAPLLKHAGLHIEPLQFLIGVKNSPPICPSIIANVPCYWSDSTGHEI
jgi:hypothetical protein